MNKDQLLEIILEKGTRRARTDVKHRIELHFYHADKNELKIEEFVDLIQAKLTELDAGFIEIYGVDEDGTAGEFLIKCQENADLEQVMDELKLITQKFSFLENSDYTLHLKTINGEPLRKAELLRTNEARQAEELEPELPLPEGFVEAKGGCMPQLSVLVCMIIGLILFLIRS